MTWQPIHEQAIEARARELHAASPARQWAPAWDGPHTNRAYYRRLARVALAKPLPDPPKES